MRDAVQSLPPAAAAESVSSSAIVSSLSDGAGIYLVDKPVGPTSFKMVQAVRSILHIKKVGHAGTLDPFASGLLVICAGRSATRMIPQLMGGEKEYVATLRLGIETDTYDLEGTVTDRKPVPVLSEQGVGEILAGFIGEQLQVPPRYSALKFKGKPLYYYARKGIEVSKAPRQVKITTLDLLGLDAESITIKIRCSKGTYIRSLAFDIGVQLGCGAHLVSLRRTVSGAFSVSSALPGETLLDRDGARLELLAQYMLSIENVKELLAG